MDIRTLDSRNTGDARLLTDEVLGNGYFSDAIASSPDDVWLGAFAVSELAGLIRAVAADGEGLIKTVAVKPSWQKKGIASALLSACLSELAPRVACVKAYSWDNGTAAQSGRLFARFGFQKVATVADYFAENTLRRNMTCPVCGNPPCRCSATLYRLDDLKRSLRLGNFVKISVIT